MTGPNEGPESEVEKQGMRAPPREVYLKDVLLRSVAEKPEFFFELDFDVNRTSEGHTHDAEPVSFFS